MRDVKQRQKALRAIRWLINGGKGDDFTPEQWSEACIRAMGLVDQRTHEAWLKRARIMGLVAEKEDGSFHVTLGEEARLA